MSLRTWHHSGDPYIWLTAGAVTASVIMVLGLLLLIAARGFGHFWPKTIYEFEYRDAAGTVMRALGERAQVETVPRNQLSGIDEIVPDEVQVLDRYLMKVGNRDAFGVDFRWILEPAISGEVRTPAAAMGVERREWGNMYGYLRAVKKQGEAIATGDDWRTLQDTLAVTNGLATRINRIERHDIGRVNYGMEQLRLRERRYALRNITDPALFEAMAAERGALDQEYARLTEQLSGTYRELNQYSMTVALSDGREVDVPLAKVVHVWRPNAMGLVPKVRFYLAKLWEFVSTDPREANTEGGIFPAIFGTVIMVLIMAVMVTPFGVIAAVYLREYAKQGPLTRAIRIAVNNLAGVPSIVYGVFGLGFFVYFLGGNIDRLFYAASLPQPTFGTPGLMWASLTLAILTVPVVIVATEEGLSRVPREIREGSLALGATKAETLWRTVLPMTASAMMTGLILAVARAAGEVAPLMMVGVVKLAPSLPLDGNFPYLHLDRKFMHLGFHIYDVGFQSPNVEAARPLVFATALLLVAIIVVLNLAAIRIRNRLREKYRAAEQN
jgi:phosphate transport system permease protein